MFHTPWLRHFLNLNRSRNDRRRAGRNRKAVRLLLESLEERLTPAAPQMAGSYTDLVNAIAADTGTNTNYVIQITNSFQFNSGGQVSISNLGSGSTLTIEGQNGTNFTLTGNGNRLFTVGAGQNVTLVDLTLTGGTVNLTSNSTTGVVQGGGLLDTGGNVTLSNVAVQNNKVSGGAAEGGGICATNGSTLTIKGGSTIQSNSAINGTASVAHHFSNVDFGGGLYVYGPGSVTISDSTIRNNSAHAGRGYDGTAPGMAGGIGGQARGGGLYVAGVNWNVTLQGDTLSGNTAISANGGNGAAGNNATGANSSGGNGGDGGPAQYADGGGAFFVVRNDSGIGTGTGTVTIANDAANPSRIVNNSVQAGSGGTGGAGGTSTGTAANSNGGNGGQAGSASGGGLTFYTFADGNTLNVNISNTTLYGNSDTGGNGGTGGAAGTGGSGAAGTPGTNSSGGFDSGGGIFYDGGNLTMVNSTIANNTTTGGSGNGSQSGGSGGGINLGVPTTIILDNNTITQNVINGSTDFGSGLAIQTGNPTLFNNLIQGNQSSNSSANDVDSFAPTLTNATDNFIGTMSANAVDTTMNIVGNTQAQLGSVVGVDSSGNPTGGPIYYPLLPGVVSIGAGTTSALSTIATVEGTTPANATDEIGNPRSMNNSIDLGAVQALSAPTITTNPSNQTVTAGGNVSFTAAASGNPVPTVQWQVSTDGGATFTDISGATSPMLTLTSVTAAMNGDEYQAVFTNSVGSATTSAATLTVQFAPTVTTNPTNQTVTAGSTATFTASASGNPTPTVQWQVSSDGGHTFTNISGATSTTLTLSNVTAAMNGNEYQAVFTNSVGSATSAAASLTVQFASAITSANNAAFTAGQSGSFTVTTTGVPAPTLTVSGLLPSGVTFTAHSNGTATLAGTPAAGTQGNYYFTITAHNGVGSDFTQNFVLTVNPVPPPQPPALHVPPLLGFINLFLAGTETLNPNGTVTVTYSFFGFMLITANYDSSGNFVSGSLFGFPIPNFIWFL